jgi:hypothetical protein
LPKRLDTPLNAQDEVALFPPIAGGWTGAFSRAGLSMSS